jgi:hypothetical protein
MQPEVLLVVSPEWEVWLPQQQAAHSTQFAITSNGVELRALK